MHPDELDEILERDGPEAAAAEITDMDLTAENCRRLMDYVAGYDDPAAYVALLTDFWPLLEPDAARAVYRRAQEIFERGAMLLTEERE